MCQNIHRYFQYIRKIQVSIYPSFPIFQTLLIVYFGMLFLCFLFYIYTLLPIKKICFANFSSFLHSQHEFIIIQPQPFNCSYLLLKDRGKGIDSSNSPFHGTHQSRTQLFIYSPDGKKRSREKNSYL